MCDAERTVLKFAADIFSDGGFVQTFTDITAMGSEAHVARLFPKIP